MAKLPNSLRIHSTNRPHLNFLEEGKLLDTCMKVLYKWVKSQTFRSQQMHFTFSAPSGDLQLTLHKVCIIL